MSSCATEWTFLVIREIALTSCPWGCLNAEDSFGSSVCAWLRLDFTVVFSLCSELPLCATEEVCFVWAWDLVCHLWRAIFQADGSEIQQATHAARDRDAFLAGKQGASFACKSVSISSPTPTNYVSLSFAQLPAAPFQCPHLWLPINTTASRHSTTRQPPVAIIAFKYCFDLNEFSLLDSYSLMEAIITMVALVLWI